MHVPPPGKCRSGKVGYAKQRQAVKEIKRQSRMANPKRRGNLNAYACSLCDEWHITSAPRLPEHMKKGPTPP